MEWDWALLEVDGSSATWRNISWRSLIAVPSAPQRPLFIRATNGPLPDQWLSEVAEHYDLETL